MNCDFLPLPDTSHRRIVWPVAGDIVRSLLASPECWILLANELRRLADAGDPGALHVVERNDKRFQPLKKSVVEYLEDILEGYIFSPDRAPARSFDPSLASFRREVFVQTSAVFGTLPDHYNGRFIPGRNPYRVLVDAHLSIGIAWADEAYKTKDQFLACDAIVNIVGHSLSRCNLLQLCLNHREDLVKQFIAQGGNVAMDLDRGQIEGLWWVLMLRSICWWSSVEVECPASNIPSRYYYSQLPVYLS